MNLGIDQFEENHKKILEGRSFSFITGSSTMDSNGKPSYLIMKEKADNLMKSIWSLQHGFFMDKQDNMILSPSFYWKELDIEVKSFYGEKLVPSDDDLKEIDMLMVDIFDVGCRVYTFVNHVAMVLQSVSGKGIDVILLDRPNPLNGITLEGNVLEMEYQSIVGQLPVPMRHGLTPAEYLLMAHKFHCLDLNMSVIGLINWNRTDLYQSLWIYPSPNMPCFKTALIYPGAVMLEGTNLSEGRGTTRPFEFVGSPYIDPISLHKELNNFHFEGVQFIPVYFKPEFSKYAGTVCKGICVHVTDPIVFHSFDVFYEIIRTVRHNYPDQFEWRRPPYEFETQRLPIDMITGSDLIRTSIEKNLSFDQIQSTVGFQIKKYRKRVQEFLMY